MPNQNQKTASTDAKEGTEIPPSTPRTSNRSWVQVVSASSDIEENGLQHAQNEGVETPIRTASCDEASSGGPFCLLPAYERSEAFIRRRVKKREGQEAIVREKMEKSSPQNETSKPVDLDEAEDEEEMIRRHSSHGSYGILESSRQGIGQFRSYRRDQLIEEIDSANKRGLEGHEHVLQTLRNARILVYIIDARICVTLTDVVDGIRKVIDHVCRDSEHRDHPSNQKCLLYRDYDGRLFNLVLTSEYSNLVGKWRGNLDSFSVVQASALATFLARILSCGFELETIDNFRQVSLTVILGVVFIEEISLSWTNVALLVRGFPSMSAYTLTSSVAGTDWIRKLLVLVLVISSSSSDKTFQKTCTLGGIILTFMILLANIGSLSWKYLHWKPFRGLTIFGNSGTLVDPFLAYMAAILAGICFPFMGHSKVEAGGTAAIESVMQMAVVVAALFILSDWDPFQRLLVLGSETCNQNYVNFFVGSWWTISLMASLTLLFCRESRKGKEFDPFKRDFTFPNDEEPLLEEEHQSPIGYKVPHLPFFPVNPSYTHKGVGSCCCSFQLGLEYALSLLVALTIGGFICYLGVTTLDDEFLENPVEAFFSNIKQSTR